MVSFFSNKTEKKQDIINKFIPIAVLKPMNNESTICVPSVKLVAEYIQIFKFPFRVGRENRAELINGTLQLRERKKSANSLPNNDLYLMDSGDLLQISREHFSIEMQAQQITLLDRGSACGVVINGKHFSGKDSGGKYPLKDGDIIGIGKVHSPYQFKFILLSEA